MKHHCLGDVGRRNKPQQNAYSRPLIPALLTLLSKTILCIQNGKAVVPVK